MSLDSSSARVRMDSAATTMQHDGAAPAWWRPAATVFFPLHLLFNGLTIGIRAEHVLINCFLLAMAWGTPRAARFSLQAMPFYAVGLIWDYLGFITPFRGPVHIGTLYAAEAALFPAPQANNLLPIWPSWFQEHTHWALDLITGAAYLSYLFQIVLLGAIFLWAKPPLGMRLAWSFLLVNVLGVLTHLIFPTAPPWYVEMYGIDAPPMDVGNHPAGATRFDELLGINYFAEFYARGTNAFGALPSLHVAYPTIVVAAMWHRGSFWRIWTLMFALTVAFAAVYLNHHYILDVVAGAAYGLCAYLLAAWALTRREQQNIRH